MSARAFPETKEGRPALNVRGTGESDGIREKKKGEPASVNQSFTLYIVLMGEDGV